jgi:protein pelota
MQILKREHDLWRLRIRSSDDLWVLARICRKGKHFGMLGERRDQTTGGIEGGRAKAAERKRMWILLYIENTEYQSFSDTLRVHGIIEEAKVDKGSHHTHLVGAGDEIELRSVAGFPTEDQRLLDDAVAAGGKPRIAIAAVESDEVTLYEVANHGIREVHQWTMRGGGKYVGQTNSDVRTSFLRNLGKDIDLQLGDDVPLILGGPGLARDQLMQLMRAEGVSRPISSVATSIGGRPAANEVLAEGLAENIMSGHSLVKEIGLLEQVWRRMGTDGAVAYGEAELVLAMQQGAIEMLLITADLLRHEEASIGGRKWPDWLAELDAIGAEWLQCSTEHDSGAQLESFGGAVALLRFKV